MLVFVHTVHREKLTGPRTSTKSNIIRYVCVDHEGRRPPTTITVSLPAWARTWLVLYLSPPPVPRSCCCGGKRKKKGMATTTTTTTIRVRLAPLRSRPLCLSSSADAGYALRLVAGWRHSPDCLLLLLYNKKENNSTKYDHHTHHHHHHHDQASCLAPLRSRTFSPLAPADAGRVLLGDSSAVGCLPSGCFSTTRRHENQFGFEKRLTIYSWYQAVKTVTVTAGVTKGWKRVPFFGRRRNLTLSFARNYVPGIIPLS